MYEERMYELKADIKCNFVLFCTFLVKKSQLFHYSDLVLHFNHN